ncbi:acyl-CoA dehydrogenase family protein [Actinophytocola sediminis]
MTMDFADSPEVAEFRAGLRAWLARRRDDAGCWHRALAEAGYVAVSLPAEYGGRGLPADYEAVIDEELARAGAPPPPPIGHLAHAIADFGSARLRARMLPGLLGGTESWCQGFSEPGAGSDLASLTTTGRLAGDHYVVDGQKTWTSGAMRANRCLLLARTEPDRPRHHGLSLLVVDLDSPGVERQEITLADGGRELAEVFFDGVRVPVANVVGEPGQGWRIAMHMLTYERGPADMGWVGRLGQVLASAVADVRAGRRVADEPLRRRLAACAVNLDVLRWQVARSLANRDTADGAAGSVDKLLTTRVEQELHHVVADLAGAGLVLGGTDAYGEYLWSRAQSIYGGTQQIQRQIVANRLLGLPR